MYSFSYLELVCSMSSSNCCFLTCKEVSQEAGQVVWYSHLFQNFPQFIVIHTVKKGFDVVSKAEVDVFLKLSCFFHDPTDVGNWICGSSAFSKASLYSWTFLGYCNCFLAKFSSSLVLSKWNWPHIYLNDFTTFFGNLHYSQLSFSSNLCLSLSLYA